MLQKQNCYGRAEHWAQLISTIDILAQTHYGTEEQGVSDLSMDC